MFKYKIYIGYDFNQNLKKHDKNHYFFKGFKKSFGMLIDLLKMFLI